MRQVKCASTMIRLLLECLVARRAEMAAHLGRRREQLGRGEGSSSPAASANRDQPNCPYRTDPDSSQEQRQRTGREVHDTLCIGGLANFLKPFGPTAAPRCHRRSVSRLGVGSASSASHPSIRPSRTRRHVGPATNKVSTGSKGRVASGQHRSVELDDRPGAAGNLLRVRPDWRRVDTLVAAELDQRVRVRLIRRSRPSHTADARCQRYCCAPCRGSSS